MRSSISNSKSPHKSLIPAHAAWVLLVVMLLSFAGVELLCRFGVPRISRIERRTAQELRSVLDGTNQASTTTRVLVLGNSLLAAGIQFDRVHQALLPDIDAKRFVVEDTQYYDWYYGMRMLFSKGARPDVVVLVLNSRQLVSLRIRGDYSAYQLIQAGDILRASRDLELSNTQASSLAFANISAFFGLRSEIRKLVAGIIFPDLPALMTKMTRQQLTPMDDEIVFATTAKRLETLRGLAAEWKSRVIVLIPPAAATNRADTAVQRAGRAAGVQVLLPVAGGSLQADHYSDGFHLNERGAEVFTASVIEALRQEVNKN